MYIPLLCMHSKDITVSVLLVDYINSQIHEIPKFYVLVSSLYKNLITFRYSVFIEVAIVVLLNNGHLS